MRSRLQLGIVLLFLMLTNTILCQDSTENVQEGDFCTVNEDCGPPKFICVQEGDLSFCKRKEIFPLYGNHLYIPLQRASKNTV